jgi:hypothetical protein
MFNLKNAAVAAVAMCGFALAPVSADASSGPQIRTRYYQRTWQIDRLIAEAERLSNAFRAAIERLDSRSDDYRYRTRTNTTQERFFDAVTPHVQRMDEAFEDLRQEANDNRYRSGYDEMVRVLQHARAIDRYFMTNRFNWGGTRNTYMRSGNLNSRWQDLRTDINALARAYGLNPIGGRVRY